MARAAAVAKTPTLKIEMVPIHSVVPYDKNPRKNDDAIPKVARSIAEFGWQQPIVVDRKMVVIVGHTRLMAARMLGHQTVPVTIAEHLSPRQVKAYRLADNRTGEEATWDEGLLASELRDLRAGAFDLVVTGFNAVELGKLRLEDVADFKTKERKLSDKLSFQVVVECDDEADQAALLARLKKEDRKCRPLTL